MPTFNQCLAKFYESIPDFRFSKQKHRKLRNIVKQRFDDRYKGIPLEYTESREVIPTKKNPTATYTVRIYPDSFVPVINKLILTFYVTHQKNIEQAKKQSLIPKKPKKKFPKKNQPSASPFVPREKQPNRYEAKPSFQKPIPQPEQKRERKKIPLNGQKPYNNPGQPVRSYRVNPKTDS